MRILLLLLVLFITIGDEALGQNHKLDSLYGVLKNYPGEDTTRVRILLRICHVEYTSYPEKNMMHAQEALKISRGLDYAKGQGEAIRYVALYHWSSGEYQQAVKYAYETLRIFERISYTKGIGLCYQLLGSIDREQGNFEKARNFQLKALTFFQKANDKRNIAYAYNAIGMLYLTWLKYDLALENFQKSLSIRKEIGDQDGLSQSYVNLATVYTSQKKYDEALKYYMVNSPVIEQLDNKYRMAENCIGMGEMYTFTGKYDLAEMCLMKAVDLAKVINYKKSLVNAYDKLSELEKRRGNYQKALDFVQLSAIQKDSLYTEDKAKQIAAAETHYQTEKKDQVIKLLASEKEIYQLWSNLLFAAFVLAIIAAIVVYELQHYREKKNRTILNLEIDLLTSQHRELSEQFKNAISNSNTKSNESQDQRLLKKVIEVVENNLGDPSFGVEKMAHDMGMSRTNMHRKIKAITGFPPSELIRSIRLRKAAVLILNKVDSVSQISLMVGFEDHSYFSKSFKKQFGVPPSEYSYAQQQLTETVQMPLST